MKRIFSLVLFIALFSIIIGCSSDESSNYQQDDFNISLLNTIGETVNISPDGKTLYAYFTGVG